MLITFDKICLVLTYNAVRPTPCLPWGFVVKKTTDCGENSDIKKKNCIDFFWNFAALKYSFTNSCARHVSGIVLWQNSTKLVLD